MVELVQLPETFQIVDNRFTAPPLYQLELIESALLQNERKKIENIKKNRKQSILLSRGIKNSNNNDKKIFQKNSKGENEKKFIEFSRLNYQILDKTNQSEKEKQNFDKVNFQRLKNTEYRNNICCNRMTKSEIMDQLEPMGNENERYEQVKLLNSRNYIKPIRETENDDDFDLLTNVKSDYSDKLAPKLSVWSDTMKFTNRVSKHKEDDDRIQAGYQILNPDCITSTAISNQLRNHPVNNFAQSGKIWTSEYQIPMMDRFPAIQQQQLNYQQPMNWNKLSISQRSIDQFITPITPVNGVFDNSIHMKPFNLNSSWIPNQAKTINRSWNTINNINTPLSFIYPRYAKSSLPNSRTILQPTTMSLLQTNQFLNNFRFYNGILSLPTITTIKSNKKKTDNRTIHDSQKQQKDPGIQIRKRYAINSKSKTRFLFSVFENRNIILLLNPNSCRVIRIQ